jgi:hypothetical protein
MARTVHREERQETLLPATQVDPRAVHLEREGAHQVEVVDRQ